MVPGEFRENTYTNTDGIHHKFYRIIVGVLEHRTFLITQYGRIGTRGRVEVQWLKNGEGWLLNSKLDTIRFARSDHGYISDSLSPRPSDWPLMPTAEVESLLWSEWEGALATELQAAGVSVFAALAAEAQGITTAEGYRAVVLKGTPIEWALAFERGTQDSR